MFITRGQPKETNSGLLMSKREAVKPRPLERESREQIRFKSAMAKFQDINHAYAEEILSMNIDNILG